jgi:leucyl aminopeptidase
MFCISKLMSNERMFKRVRIKYNIVDENDGGVTMNFSVELNEARQVETDVFVFALAKDEALSYSCYVELNQALDGQLELFLKDETVSRGRKETHLIPTFGKAGAKYVMFVGLGDRQEVRMAEVKEIIARVTREVNKKKLHKVTYCFDSFLTEAYAEQELAHALAEATVLASYQFDHYKTGKKDQHTLDAVTVKLCQSNAEDVQMGLETGRIFAEGTCLARDLVNTPGNKMTPSILAAKAEEIGERHGMEVSILERAEMEELGMGALLAVAQGSDEPPKMIVIKYQGRDEWDDVLALVGKGLTFDTGGISLKPAAKMHEMKMDMGGGAAVLGAMEIIGRIKPKTNVLAVIPSTENMPSGKALKPGDVITSLSGKTIEVRNTDAEGRLILADGITYAKQLGANYIVDVATLTGAVIVALADISTGAVTNDEDFMIDVLEASEETGEWIWRLPSYEPYKEKVRSSDVADLNNSPGREGGSITAGLFLGEFAEDTPWVHLDIAGTAWSAKGNDLTPQGGTGVIARTLATLASQRAEDEAADQ